MRPVGFAMIGALALTLVFAPRPGRAAAAPASPEELTLDNGLRVVCQRDPGAALTVLQLVVRSGSRNDPAGQAGLDYLAARLCLEVPEESELRRLLEMGSSFMLRIFPDYMTIILRTRSIHFEAALAILAGNVGSPLFSNLRIDSIKEIMEFLQKQEEDDADTCMVERQAAAFFGSTAYGTSAFGSAASRKTIDRRDVQECHRRIFAAGNLMAVVISDLDGETLRAMLARHLGRLSAGPAIVPATVPLSETASPPQVVERQAAQVLLARSARLPAMTPDTFFSATLLESWLGQGINSQLWALRERLQLAYEVRADFHPMREAALLHAYLKTTRQRAAEADRALDGLLRKIWERGITAPELAAAKAYARADFERLMEMREQRATVLAMLEGLGLGWPLAAEWPRRLEAVGAEEMNRLIHEQLDPQKLRRLRIGPAE
jgi:zinc protease